VSEIPEDRAVVLKQHEEYVSARQDRSELEHEFALVLDRRSKARQALRDLDLETVSLERRLRQAEKRENECWLSLGVLPRKE